jgi:ribonuclease P protein component
MSQSAEFGFPRQCRLLTAKHYQQAFSNPKRVSCPELLILFKPNDCQHSRLGMAIAKKQIKRAVDRNRVKRIIRETYRLNQQRLPNLDLVVLARKSILAMDNQQFQGKLLRLFEQVANKASKS